MTRWLLLLAFALVLVAAYAKQEEENVDLEELEKVVKKLEASDLTEKEEKFLFGIISSVVRRVGDAAHTLLLGRRRRRRRRRHHIYYYSYGK